MDFNYPGSFALGSMQSGGLRTLGRYGGTDPFTFLPSRSAALRRMATGGASPASGPPQPGPSLAAGGEDPRATLFRQLGLSAPPASNEEMFSRLGLAMPKPPAHPYANVLSAAGVEPPTPHPYAGLYENMGLEAPTDWSPAYQAMGLEPPDPRRQLQRRLGLDPGEDPRQRALLDAVMQRPAP